MSRFFSSKYSSLEAYTPGEQPKDMKYIKLNTNESPFPPSPKVTEYAKAESEKLNLYSDLISHRITTLSAADKIIVLDRGRIVEEGTHEELKLGGGIYQKIYEAQSGAQEVAV